VPENQAAKRPDEQGLRHILSREWFLLIALGTSLIFMLFGETLFAGLSNQLILTLLFLWLFFVVLGSALGVVRNAEQLSRRLGEPYGTLVLTLAMTAIEVMSITAVMTHGDSNPTLVRDTLFSVVMLVMGGMVGISLLLGAFRHREQAINLQGANAYLGVIVPLLVLCLVLPSFTRTTEMPTLSTIQQIMLGIMAMGLYATFLMMQMGRHRAYFMQPGDEPTPALADRTGLLPHFVLLLVNMLPVVLLVQQLARPVDHIIETLGAPHIIGGLIMAVMIATPEGLGGIKAALRNQLQTSVNVFLGSVLAAVGLSIPIMLLVSNLLGLELILGLDATEMVLLLLMFAVSVITFSSGRTNLLQGAVHLLLFVAFLVLQIES